MALIKAVRREQAQTAVMVLAAYDTPGLRHQMKALSIRHYQVKPIMVSDLAAAVRVAVQGPNAWGSAICGEGAGPKRPLKPHCMLCAGLQQWVIVWIRTRPRGYSCDR